MTPLLLLKIFTDVWLIRRKIKGKDLIREATKEMFVPIMSSTIVTMAVFLPLGLVKGMIGEIFLPFALTIVFAFSIITSSGYNRADASSFLI